MAGEHVHCEVPQSVCDEQSAAEGQGLGQEAAGHWLRSTGRQGRCGAAGPQSPWYWLHQLTKLGLTCAWSSLHGHTFQLWVTSVSVQLHSFEVGKCMHQV